MNAGSAVYGLLVYAVCLCSVGNSRAMGQSTFTVTPQGFTAYLINSAPNPTLTLMRGFTYTFNINAVGHPRARAAIATLVK